MARWALACLAGAAAALATGGYAAVSAASVPVVTVSQSTGLRDHQSIRVRATGFIAGEPLVAIECAENDNQENTEQSDCNINAAQSVVADRSGAVDTMLTVFTGPFGSHGRVCSPHSPCLVGVSEISLMPERAASTLIAFAPGARPAVVPASPPASTPTSSSSPGIVFSLLIVLGILFILAEYDSWSVVRRIARAGFGGRRRPEDVAPLR